jgi:hypothetical protein
MTGHFVHRKTVTAAIDASRMGENQWIAIRYVKKDGSEATYRVRKIMSVRQRFKRGKNHRAKQGDYHVKEKAMMRVIVESHGQPRSFFIFAITHANLEGDLNNLHRVEHERQIS